MQGQRVEMGERHQQQAQAGEQQMGVIERPTQPDGQVIDRGVGTDAGQQVQTRNNDWNHP